MRRLVILLVSWLLAGQVLAAFAPGRAPCCKEACVDASLCVTATCPACPGVALLPSEAKLPVAGAVEHATPSEPAAHPGPAAEIWKPPRPMDASTHPFFQLRSLP